MSLNLKEETKNILNTYLKYHQEDSLFSGKNNFSENKWVWVVISKDKYTYGEIISVKKKIVKI